MVNVRAFLRLIRLDFTVFAAIGVIIGGLLSGDLTGFQGEYVIACCIVILFSAGNFAFNDYFDYEIDKNNQREDRPLVNGFFSRRLAFTIGVVSFCLVIVLALLLNTLAMVLVLISLPVFFSYSAWFKKVFLVKNILMAFAYVAVIVFGSLVSDSTLEPLIIYFAAMSFIVGLGYEIMLDIGDVTGDAARGVRTFSTRYSKKSAALISSIIYIVIIFMDPLPVFINIDSRLSHDYIFLILIMIPVISYIFVVRSLLKDQSKDNIFRLKKRIYLIMQIGCVAYLVGVFL